MQFTKNCKCELLRPSVMHDWLQIMRNDNTQVTTRQRIVFGRPFVKRFALCYRTVVLPVLSVCNVRVLWPNGWTDQDESWHAGRPRPWSHCVRWGPSSPPSKMHSPQFSAHVCCGQRAGWNKIPLGVEIGLGPGDIVLDGDPAPLPKKGAGPQFSAYVYCGKTAE